MPRLLRGVARTAVVAGTATSVSNRVSRRQANRWSAQPSEQPQAAAPPPAPAPPAPAAPPAPPADTVAQLTGLAKLRDDGILTDEEFAAEKRKILA
jgi:hypothetical protein